MDVSCVDGFVGVVDAGVGDFDAGVDGVCNKDKRGRSKQEELTCG